MVELKKLKIKKQLYKFEVRKRYQYSRNYKIKEIRPIDKILRSISGSFKKPKKEEARKVIAAQPRAGIPLYIFVILAVLVLLIGGLFILAQSAKKSELFATRAFVTPELNFELLEKGVVTASSKEEPANVAYLRFSYSTKAVQTMNISFWTYQFNVPSEIFILRSAMDSSQTTSYPDFKSVLKKELWSKKISVNEIDLEQVETLQKGSVLIVPSGYAPQQLLGVGSNFDIKELIDRGVVIIYVGYPFDHMIDSKNQVIQTPASAMARLPFTFAYDSKSVPQSLNIDGPYYSARSTGQYENFQLYGVVSVVKRGDGAILFVPQSLDVGWRKDGVAAAKDIAKVIRDIQWVSPDSQVPSTYYFNASENATVTDFFTLTFSGSSRYVKMEVDGIDINGDLIGEQRIVSVEKKPLGSLYVQGGYSVASSDITGNPVKFFADLKEPKVEQKLLYLSFTKDGQEVIDKKIANTNPLSLQVETQLLMPVTLDTGFYIVSLVDDEGKIYAQSLLDMVFVDVNRLPELKEREVFQFQFTKGGSPVVLDGVVVNVKSEGGQDFGTYTLNRTSEPTVDVSKKVIGDTRLPFGRYVFTFKIGSITKPVKVDLTAPENVFLSPPFLVVGGLSIGILLMGIYFSRKEGVVYLLDVPDFPPISKTKIPIKTDTVLGVFEKVDEDYKWKNTPLTIQELKNGFKKIFFEGRPIFISDYNMEFIMDKLVQKKLVRKFLEYYSPITWEEQTKRSTRYLGLFRKLRDIFVNNAVPFSQMGEESNCDTKIDLMGQEMFIHVYDKRGDMQKFVSDILDTTKMGLSIVLFKDLDEKSDFRDILSSASPVSAALKMEVESNAVQLMDVVGFESMIKEMKNI